MKNILIVTLLIVFGGLFAESMFDITMNELGKDYDKVKDLLDAKKTDGVNGIAKSMLKKIDKLDGVKEQSDNAAKYADLPKQLKKSAQKLVKAKNLQSMRSAFAGMSKPMEIWNSAKELTPELKSPKKINSKTNNLKKDMKHEMKKTSLENEKCDENCKDDEKKDKAHDMKKEMKHEMKSTSLENHNCDENCKHDEVKKEQKKNTDTKIDKLKGKI